METRFDTGTKISAAGHVVLLGWLLVGPIFRSEPLPMNIQDVSVISAQAFAALQAPSAPAPEVATEVALPQETPPDVTAPETPAVASPPERPQAPVTPPPEPAPVAEAPPAAPEPPAPEPPAPQQADRVAAEAVPAPEPEAAPAPEQQDAVDEEGDEAVQEATPRQATAPQEAATELATEADLPSGTMTRSLRPPSSRPARPVQTAAPVPETPAPETPETPETQPAPEEPSQEVADAVASAVAEAQRPAAPSGPPLTGGELDGLRVAVGACWNVGTLSTEAQETAVTVYVRMNENGTPALDTMKMVTFTGGSAESAARVYRSARSAIARCGRNGFPLPPEKYGRWREIEMTFNPEGMFWR